MQSKQRQSAIAVKAVMWLYKPTKSQGGEQGKRANRRITQDIKDIASIARLTLFASQNLPEDEASKRKRGKEGEKLNKGMRDGQSKQQNGRGQGKIHNKNNNNKQQQKEK